MSCLGVISLFFTYKPLKGKAKSQCKTVQSWIITFILFLKLPASLGCSLYCLKMLSVVILVGLARFFIGLIMCNGLMPTFTQMEEIHINATFYSFKTVA